MKREIWVGIIVILIAIVFTSGCANVAFGNVQASNFGTSPEQQKVLDCYISTYGDPKGSGNPQLNELMVTSNVVNDLPQDKVTAFSKNTEKIYFWVIYAHFTKGDTLTMKLDYAPNSHTVVTTEQPATGQYGAASGSIEKPKSGDWPTGTYALTVSGRGISQIVYFDIINGAAQTVLLPCQQQGGVQVGGAHPLGQNKPVAGIKDYTSDNDNCGYAGNVCKGGKICRDSVCGCASGATLCPGDYCAILGKDDNNCGKCGSKCTSGLHCASGACGTCTPSCSPDPQRGMGAKRCGGDGCGGTCGGCGDNEVCSDPGGGYCVSK